MNRHTRLPALLLVCAMLLAACGSRLSDEDRAIAIQGIAGAGGTVVTTDGATTDTAAGTTAAGTTSTGTSTSTATGSTGAAASTSTGTTTTSTETTGTTTTTTGTTGTTTTTTGTATQPDPAATTAAQQPAAQETAAPQQQEQPTDTRLAPEGGNGGATAIGVTEDKIVLGNVSDVSGAVPGIFEPSQLAVKAYIAYFNATEGTIYGRTLEYLPKDGKLDTGANRAASLELCEQAFMGVGSMSANDQGAAPVIDECDIPDLRTAQTTDQMAAVTDNAFATSVNAIGKEGLGAYEWIASAYPDAIKAASFVYICGEVTEQNTASLRKAQTDALGFNYVYNQCIEIQETNYAPFVATMKDRNVEYVAFQGAYQQAVRLAETMRQQDYFPTVYALQSNIYNQNFLKLGGEAVEDSMVITSSVPAEEANTSQELQLYIQWLNQVAPGEQADGLGMYSWSAAKLAVELLKEVGPNLTREAMIEAIRGVSDWTGGGLHGPGDIGGRSRPINCSNVLQVQGGQFVKIHPANGPFQCSDLIADVSRRR